MAAGEADISEARKLREAFLQGRCRLSAPDLLLMELANALTSRHRQKLQRVLDALDTFLGLDIELAPFQLATLTKAAQLASSYAIAVYDCYFWAMAIGVQGILITADESFLRKAGNHPNVVSLRKVRLP